MSQADNNVISQMADILEGKTPPPSAPPVIEPTAAPPVVQTPPADAPPAPVAPPVAAAPTQTTPPNTPAKVETPTFDFDAELLKNSGGRVKSSTDLSALIENANRLADFESKLKVYEDENTSLKAKVATDPFANDYTKRLNDLYKSGASESQIQAFTALNKVANLDGLSPVDAKILELQVKNGLTTEQAQRYINATYKIGDDYDAETVENEKIRLQVDATASREFLKTHKAEVSKVPENPAEAQQREYVQKQTEHVARLQPIAKNVATEAVNYFKGLSLNGKQGQENVTADFGVTDESIKGLEPLIQKFVEANWENIPANEKGIEQIKAYAENLLAIQNYKNWIINAASEREKQVRAEYTNPTPLVRNNDNPNPGKSSKEQMDAAVLAAYN